MQAVILAAGVSSRFHPYNLVHKSLFSIFGEPIIVHTLRSIKRSGINDVIIVVGKNNFFQDVLGNGKKYGVKITYTTLSSPTGMGDALLAASKFIKSDFFLINPQHLEFDMLVSDIDKKRGTNQNAILLADKTPADIRYGALKVEGDRVTKVAEKPTTSQGFSNLRIIGVYFLNNDFVNVLRKTSKDHYSFEKALDTYAKMGRVRVVETSQDIVTLKYPWDLIGLKDYMFRKIKRKISKGATIAKSAIVEGNVVIEDGAVISDNAVIKGPVYIGENVFIGTNALIRENSSIESGAKIGAYMEVRGSLISSGVTTHSGFIGDSVIGKNTKVGAIFGTANVRLDRQNVKIKSGDKIHDTGFKRFGTLIGENVVVGERVSTMPGAVIGNNVHIGPSTTVMKNVDSDTLFYTKFVEVVEKNISLEKKGKPAASKPR